MKTIVILSHRDIKHYAGGGATLYIHQIFRRLTHKYEITIVSTEDSGLPQREVVDGLKILRLPHRRLGRVFLPLSIVTGLAGRADIIVDNGDVALPWLTPLFNQTPKVCIIYQVAGEIFNHELPRPLSDIAIRVEPWVYRIYRNSKIITCSASTKSELVRLGLTDANITVIRPGLGEAFAQFEPDGKKFDNPTIVCISRFMKYKGVQYAIQSMRHIIEKIPDAQLIIAGNGDDSAIRRQLSGLAYSGSVKIIERTPHLWDDEKKRLLAGAHVMLMPSVREGYGIVVIEANACGTSAVGWDVPGLRDSILDGKTGILVPFEDTNKLAEQVIALISDGPLRSRMAASAVKWARAHSWDKAAKEFDNVLDAVS